MNETTKLSATDRRCQAIRSLSDRLLPLVDAECMTADEMANEVRKLATLGRTDRWKNAVEGWAGMFATYGVREWTIIQGAIYTAHQA